jgi:hypothetical protein
MSIEFRCAGCKQHLRVADESVGNNARCPQCQALMQIPPRTLAGRWGLPWERKGSLAPIRFLQTAALVAFRPHRAFERMRQGGSYRGPMLYSAIGFFIGLLGLTCIEVLVLYFTLENLPLPPETIELIKKLLPIALVAAAVIGVPLMATLGNLIGAGMLHVALLISGGSQQSFATSFRIVCYVQPSLMWLLFIPGGSFFLTIWTLIVSIIAVRQAHEVPLGRAVVAVLLPLVATSLLTSAAVLVFVVSLAAMFATQQP